MVFPRGESLWPFILRFIRYGLLGVWVAAGAPLFFRAIRLA
jgi:cell division protein FtsX